ncbi:MAG: hypothetical protein M3O15_16200 [Acidobacteriota bacterium]|nr:hypothetical protein [Acidobacteriota bacterium]
MAEADAGRMAAWKLDTDGSGDFGGSLLTGSTSTPHYLESDLDKGIVA